MPIRIHWTLLLIVVYLGWAFSLRFTALARQVGPSELAPLGWGLLIAIGLFAGVLLHELGHALVARGLGARVRGITLTFFGGLSDIGEMPRPFWREAVIAGIGPVVSLALAALAYLGGLLVDRAAQPELSLALGLLAQINLVLAIFNLLPAFPMDGGRVLRSLLAQRMGRLRATEIAAKVGKAFAIAFAALALLGNFVLVVIALMVWTMADTELKSERMRGLLTGLKARDLRDPGQPVVVDAAATILAAAEQMAVEGGVVALVREGDTIIGGLQARAIEALPPRSWTEATAGQLAQPLPLIREETAADKAFALVLEAGMAALCRNGELLGLITPESMAQALSLARLRSELRTQGPGRLITVT